MKALAIINAITLSVALIIKIVQTIYLYVAVLDFEYSSVTLNILMQTLMSLVFHVPLIIFFIAFAMNYNNTKNKEGA